MKARTLCAGIVMCLGLSGLTNPTAAEGTKLLGYEVPGIDSIAIPSMPDWLDKDIALDKAMHHYADVSKQIAQVTPQLTQLGFTVSNFKTELLPPSVRLRLVSHEVGVPAELVAPPDDLSLLATAVLKSAETAKQVQAALGLEVVVMDVTVGAAPSIKLSYLKSADEARLASQLQDINDSCTAGP